MSGSSLKERTAKGLLWGGVSNGVVQVIGMLFGLFLARILDIEDYGLVAMLQIFSAVANTVIDSGFAVALINKKETEHKDYNAVFWFTTLVCLAVYLILFFSAPFIAQFYEKPELILLSRVVFLSFVFGGVANVSHTILFKHLMVKERGWIDITSILLSGGIGLGMAFADYGYWALAIQSLLYIALNSILKIIVAPWKPSLPVSFAPLKEMFSFSIKLFLTNIIVQVNKNAFTMISGKLFGEWQLGLYSQGEKWMHMCSNILTGMVGSVAHPVLVHVREERERSLNVFRKMIRFAAFVSFPIMLGVAFVAEEFIPLAIGEKWLPSIPFLQMLCVVGTVWPIWHLYTYTIISYGRSNLYLIGNVVQGFLQISALLLTARWGIYWMVVAYITTYFISLAYWHYCVHRLIGLKISQLLKDVLPYLGIVLGIFALVWFVTLPISNALLLLISKIGLSVALYCTILWFSGSVLFRETLEVLLKREIRRK